MISFPMEINVLITNQSNYTLADTSWVLLLIHGITSALASLLGLIVHVYFVLVFICKRKSLERGAIIVFQVLLANIAHLIFYNVSVSVSAIGRNWLLGNTLCVATTVIYMGAFVLRWSMIFIHSIHYFSTVFFPFKYPRVSKVSLTIMITVAWILLMAAGVFRTVTGIFFFNIHHPLCSIAQKSITTAAVSAIVIMSIIPASLYFSLWIKSRMIVYKLRRITINSVYPPDQTIPMRRSNTLNQVKREIKSALTLGLMLITSIITTVAAYTNDATDDFFPATNDMALVCHFALTYPVLVYPLFDALFLIRNVNTRNAVNSFNKDMHNIIKKILHQY